MTEKLIKRGFKNLVLLHFASFFMLSCRAQIDFNKLADSLVQKERIDDTELFLKISKSGKEAIPYLINVIDKEEKGFVGFQDKNSSTLYPIHMNCVGIRAAYMVQCIIANKNNQRLFNYCVIVKQHDNKPLMQPLNFDDMKSIKKIYKIWWDSNKQRSMSELSNDWDMHKQALTGSDYLWK